MSVSLLMPGPVLTESLASTFKILETDQDNRQIRQQFSKEVEALLRERMISTQQCAQRALHGLKQGLFYIPTQSYIKLDIDRRHDEIERAFAALDAGQ
jgi:short-subunit dehydrogenase